MLIRYSWNYKRIKNMGEIWMQITLAFFIKYNHFNWIKRFNEKFDTI
jgi:hypothetical protein